jgi:hypothetical protein
MHPRLDDEHRYSFFLFLYWDLKPTEQTAGVQVGRQEVTFARHGSIRR